MNERIRELMDQATTIVEPNDPDYRHEIFDKEKFAELIVRECAEICYNRDYTCGSAYGDAIAEHFGL